jgi:hypothetical protein
MNTRKADKIWTWVCMMLAIVCVTLYRNEAADKPNDFMTLGAIILISLLWIIMAIRGVEREHVRRKAELEREHLLKYQKFHMTWGRCKVVRDWNNIECVIETPDGERHIVAKNRVKECREPETANPAHVEPPAPWPRS